MKGARGWQPVAVAIVGLLVALGLAIWLTGLSPQFTTAVAGPLPLQRAPAWVTRLGLVDAAAGGAPNPLVQDRLDTLGDTAAGAALRSDLCTGKDMQPDEAFRRVRRALVVNDPALCSGLAAQVEARSPVIVALGPAIGWPVVLGLLVVLALFGAWRLWSLKRRHDRWRLLGRSTFGASRRAGSG
jgi:hypothetical protein